MTEDPERRGAPDQIRFTTQSRSARSGGGSSRHVRARQPCASASGQLSPPAGLPVDPLPPRNGEAALPRLDRLATWLITTVRSAPVSLTPGPHVLDPDLALIVVNLVQDAVVALANPQDTRHADDWPNASWPRIISEFIDSRTDAFPDRVIELAKVLACLFAPRNPVARACTIGLPRP